MQRVAVKEFGIYVALLALLAVAIHPDLLAAPLQRVASMQERGNFYHPFVYSFLFYSLLFIVRFLFQKIAFLLLRFKRDKS